MTIKDNPGWVLKILPELIGLSGVILIAGGIWMIYVPASIIFLGLICACVYLWKTIKQINGGRK